MGTGEKIMRFALGLLALLAAASVHAPVHAEVMASAPGGFAVKENFQTAATPARVWAVLVTPARWWDSEHTWSGSAANLTLEARAGGCWCETLPDGGSAQHMAVDFVEPGRTLRMRGTLGPLGALAVTGVMGVSIEPDGAGSSVTLTYLVGGYIPVDIQSIAPSVDTVLAAQMARLKAAAEVP
jgi:uncharacterized protein YndB with AHSA1/START domain